MENNNIIILEDQDGCEVEFEVIDVFEFNDITYFALVEVIPEDTSESTDVLLMKVIGEDGEEELVMPDNDEEAMAAFNEFLRRDEEADTRTQN